VCVCVEKDHCFKEELLEVTKTIQHLLLVFEQQLSHHCGSEFAIHPVCLYIHFLHFKRESHIDVDYLCNSVGKIYYMQQKMTMHDNRNPVTTKVGKT